MGRKRIIAFVFDIICIILLCLFLSVILSRINPPYLDSIIPSILFYIALFCKDCYNGASWGKHIMRIQIVDKKTMEPASPFKCMIRNLLYPLWIVELIVFYSNKDRKRLGDYITNTEVIDGTKKAKSTNWLQIIVCISIIIILYLTIFFYLYHTNHLFQMIYCNPT